MIKKHWWKCLGALLILYAIIAGLRIPIKPALVDESSKTVQVAKAGTALTIKTLGYNTQFTKSSSVNVWLTILDSTRNAQGLPNVYPLKSVKVRVLDDRHVEADFNLPSALPLSNLLQTANLVVESEKEGLLIRNAIIQVQQDTINTDLGQATWRDKMDISTPSLKSLTFPNLSLTRESIRNTFFHVPMWFVMFTMYAIALYHSLRHLRRKDFESDIKAVSFTRVGTVFGLLGLMTGGMWANYTWGQPFPIQEIKLLMTYTALAIYLAYFVLRASFDDFEKRGRISAVYAIFAFSSLVPLLYVIPKLAQASNHPGNGGTQTIAAQDLDNTLRMVFYPASIGWILIGLWIATLVCRYELLKDHVLSKNSH
jgi:heme exporter protein C